MKDESQTEGVSALELLKLLQNVCGRVMISSENDKWTAEFPNVKFKSELPLHHRSGDSPESAIREAWFWITGEESRDNFLRYVDPAERNCIIRNWGNYEIWYRWDGAGFQVHVIQPRDGWVLVSGDEYDQMIARAS